jgi:hypothetical protein
VCPHITRSTCHRRVQAACPPYIDGLAPIVECATCDIAFGERHSMSWQLAR